MSSAVSIIVPVYNAEKTLRKCVESLVYGLEKNIEVILVDDCSWDNSWNLCQELQEEFINVKCVQNNQNQGVSYTRNHGIEEADGDWIMFTDSDDWVSGRFVSTLLRTTEKYENSLVTCGFHYIDKSAYNKVDYLWDPESIERRVEIQGEELFDAVDRIMLQNVWNKIFCREIIRKNNIKFDETQSMGEDFRFVLDYMQAADLRACTVINEALYYYVRANQSSLMSNFGWSTNNLTFQRMEQLAEICGIDNQNVQERLEKQKLKLKKNSIYHVVRTSKKTKREKLDRIEQIAGDENGKKYYNQQIRCYRKEKLSELLSELLKLSEGINGKIQRTKRDRLLKKEYEKLKVKDFSVISQNCIGGIFYHDMRMQFLSPTINLFFKAPDFVRFVSNLKYYISLEPEMRWEEEYPVGKLDDVEIYFMHYQSCKEAKEIWNKRKSRINYEKILVLSTDRNGFTDEIYKKWEEIPYKKILFTVKKQYCKGEAVAYPEYQKDGYVPDLIPKREFYKEGILINTVNSME